MERKNEPSLHKFCTNCGSSKFKNWKDLTSDEKFIAERTWRAKFSAAETKELRFCARCLYADINAEKRA